MKELLIIFTFFIIFSYINCEWSDSAKEAFKNLWNCMPKAYKDLL